jgi:hypothetical protein
MPKIGLLGIGLLAMFSAFAIGTYIGIEWEKGNQAQEQVIIKNVQKAASDAAADAIAKLEIKHTTINREIRRETIKEPIYIDCRHTPIGLQLLNDALRGPGVGSGKLPSITGGVD